MPRFGKRSTTNLNTCHEDLQEILKEAIKYADFSVLEGHRSKELQDQYFKEHRSKVKFPHSKHNQIPSLAVDIAPYPIDWTDIKRFIAVVYFIKGIATNKGIKLGIGVDWNGDFKFNESFVDAPHIELIEKYDPIKKQWIKYN